MASKYTYGNIGRPRKLVPQERGRNYPVKAGRKLRRQAIERTVQEIEEPYQVWGISMSRIGRSYSPALGMAWIREHAERRLRVLEGLSAK